LASSIGGAAIGWLAMGGYAFGTHYAGGNGANPTGVTAFKTLAPVMQNVFHASMVVFVLGFVAMFVARWWAARQSKPASVPLRAEPSTAPAVTPLEKIVLAILCVAGLVWFLTFQHDSVGENSAAAQQVISIGAVAPWFHSHRVQGKSVN
jgi:hypothetical protein